MDHDTQSEVAFWYNILYFIGAHVRDVVRSYNESLQQLNPNSQQGESVHKISNTTEINVDSETNTSDSEFDTLSKIFCGYWILNTIANIDNQHHENEDKDEV